MQATSPASDSLHLSQKPQPHTPSIYAPSSVPRRYAPGAVILASPRDLEWREAPTDRRALYLRKQDNCVFVDLDGRCSDSELRSLRRQAEGIKTRRGDPSRQWPLVFDLEGKLLPHWEGKIPIKNLEAAEALKSRALVSKARRRALCGVLARRQDCLSGHRFYKRSMCGNRYCPTCGPKCFRNLFTKYVRLKPIVDHLQSHPTKDARKRLMAKVDITRRNTYTMPTNEQVRKFGEDVKKLFGARGAVQKEFNLNNDEYGFLGEDEFGSGNSNLHMHGGYVGPWLSQKKLSRLWAQICNDGSFIISIKRAKSFEAVLSHALKYPSKFWDAPSERLADLEKAFHRVRRFHTFGAFYNAPLDREPGEDSEAHQCPICGDLLLDAPGYHFVESLEKEGRRDLDVIRQEEKRARVLSAKPPP